ncbi:MAG: ribulose-phosphate 3-epimerase [Bacteroidetes bacterium]|nr:ribulose-phosphate 3-epimerase [Bacteroidota bacterium]
MPIVAPSLLSANFLNLQADCELLNKSEADWYHLDVMDGVFVPNISFGPMLIHFFRKATAKTCDVHLMIEKPERYLTAFKEAGADIITVHAEACIHLHRTIQQIKELGIKAGVALNPHTPVASLTNVIRDIDLVCLMSVNPGFGGQQFIPSTLPKITELKKLISQYNSAALIEVDGGVTLENAPSIIEAGADVLVAGNTVFKSKDPLQTIASLKRMGTNT